MITYCIYMHSVILYSNEFLENISRFSQGNHTDFRIDVEGLDRPSWTLYLCGYSSRGRKGHLYGPVRPGNALNMAPVLPLNSSINTHIRSYVLPCALGVCAVCERVSEGFFRCLFFSFAKLHLKTLVTFEYQARVCHYSNVI